MTVHDFVYQLRQRLDGFSPVERRVADAILADIPAAAQSGVGELAVHRIGRSVRIAEDDLQAYLRRVRG